MSLVTVCAVEIEAGDAENLSLNLLGARELRLDIKGHRRAIHGSRRRRSRGTPRAAVSVFIAAFHRRRKGQGSLSHQTNRLFDSVARRASGCDF
jgi:hypothetical protein